MNCLTIHIRPDLQPELDVAAVISDCRAAGRYPEVEYPDEQEAERYINLNFFSESLTKLWADISSSVLAGPHGPKLKTACVIACEGGHGWDDLITLHHYDPKEQTGSL